MEEADKLIEALPRLHLQSLSLMHPVMIQDQHSLEDRLMRRLRLAPVLGRPSRLHLGLRLSALSTLIEPELLPTKAIDELWIEFSRDDPLIDVSDMVFLDAFPCVKPPSLGITPFRDAEVGLSGIED
jgi:hypothetical protein